MVECGKQDHRSIILKPHAAPIDMEKNLVQRQDENKSTNSSTKIQCVPSHSAPETLIVSQPPFEHADVAHDGTTESKNGETTSTHTKVETKADGESEGVTTKPRGGYRRKIRASNFVPVLRQMIEDEELLAWSDDGKKFQIFDIHSFEEDVLPKYFSHNRFQSFQRQLNYFGFSRCKSVRCPHSQEQGTVFAHEDFCRDNPEREAFVVKRHKKVSGVPPAGGSSSRGTKRQRADETESESGGSRRKPRTEASTSSNTTAGVAEAKGQDCSRGYEKGWQDWGQRGQGDSLSLLASLASFVEDRMASTAPTDGGFQDETKSCKDDTKTGSHGKPQALSIEEVRASLPRPSCVYDPTKSHKTSEIDKHGVRFKMGGEDGRWRWKCRFCLQTILVGHGAPNVHLKKLHPEVFVGGRKKVLHGEKEKEKVGPSGPFPSSSIGASSPGVNAERVKVEHSSPLPSPPHFSRVKVERVERCENATTGAGAAVTEKGLRSGVQVDMPLPERIAVDGSCVRLPEEGKREDQLSQPKTRVLNMPHTTDPKLTVRRKRKLDEACPRLLLESTKRNSPRPLEPILEPIAVPQKPSELRLLLESTMVQSKKPRLTPIHDSWQPSLQSLLESSKPRSIPRTLSEPHVWSLCPAF